METATAYRALAWGLVWLGIAVLAVLAWQLRLLLMLVFLALLVAAALHAPFCFLVRRGIPAIASVLAVYGAIGLVAGLIGWAVVPPLVEQLAQLVDATPRFVDAVQSWLRTLVERLPEPIAGGGLSGFGERLLGVLPSVEGLVAIPLLLVEIVVNLVLVLFLSALLLLERRKITDSVLAYVSPAHRERVARVGATAAGKLGAYVRGQLIIMAVTGIGTGIGMFVLGVPFVLPLSLFAFLTEAIPIAGPYIAGVPIVAVAFSESPLTGMLMAGWMLALQQLEGYILIPIVQKHAVSVSPVVVLLAVAAGASLAGILGALIAIPAVAVIQVVLREVVLPLRQASWGEA